MELFCHDSLHSILALHGQGPLLMLQPFCRHKLAIRGLAVVAFSSSSRLESADLNQRKADSDKLRASLQSVARAATRRWMIRNRAYSSLLPKFKTV